MPKARDEITIEGLRVDCIVGLYPHERDQPQPLLVDVTLRLDTEEAGRSQSLRASVDYAQLAPQIEFLLQNGRFPMLETAAHALSLLVLLPPAPGERRAAVEEVTIRLTKPGALLGNGRPSLVVRRERDFAPIAVEEKPFGTVDRLLETREVGIYRLNLLPGRAIPLHVHERMQEVEMILGDGLLCQERPFPPGTVHRWPVGAAHRYDNPTTQGQSILCVDAPRFLPEDEIEVSGAPAQVPPERLGFSPTPP